MKRRTISPAVNAAPETRHEDNMRQRPCYGTKLYGRQAECSGCSMSTHCRDARDIRPLGHTLFEKIEYAEQYAQPQKKNNTAQKKLHSILDFMDKMNALHRNNPKAYKMLVEKIRHPELSLSDIASQIGCDKQLCHYHLKKLIRTHAEFKEVIIFDTRYRRKKQLKNGGRK